MTRFYATLLVSGDSARSVEVEILANDMQEALAQIEALSVGFQLGLGYGSGGPLLYEALIQHSISVAHIGAKPQRGHKYVALTYKGLREGLSK